MHRILCACLVVAVQLPSHAESSREFIPEFNGFFKLTERARIFLLADLTQRHPENATTGEAGIHVDYTLHPLLRPALRKADWERNRYLWMRAGFQRSGNISGDDPSPSENRWLLELTARVGLGGEATMVNRLRLDLRDIDGAHSRRYRYRAGVEKEFTTGGGTRFVPYAQAEGFYDTRFDAWSRWVVQGGAEFGLSEHWRIEPYLAYERNTRPRDGSVSRLGLVLKYHH